MINDEQIEKKCKFEPKPERKDVMHFGKKTTFTTAPKFGICKTEIQIHDSSLAYTGPDDTLGLVMNPYMIT